MCQLLLGQLTDDFGNIMEKASKGISLAELMEELDSNLIYGGARRISEYEAELLDQLDDSFDNQLKLQRNEDSLTRALNRSEEKLKITDRAIGEYCSEETRGKILLARGWQFRSEEADRIKEALSDKEIVRSLALQQIGQATTGDFRANPEQAIKAFEALETGVRTQQNIKEGVTQGEE